MHFTSLFHQGFQSRSKEACRLNAACFHTSLTSIAALVIAAVGLGLPAPLKADTFPSKPVRVITPFPTGILPDHVMRLMAQKLAQYWQQSVIVEPRVGGNGVIAISAAKRAPADGYTILVLGSAHLAVNPHIFKKQPFDLDQDFVPVAQIYQSPFFMAVAANSPYESVADIVKAAAEDPKKIAYSSAYVGSPPHFGGALLAHSTHTEMLPVHYNDGPQLLTSVANGDVTFSFAISRTIEPLVAAGKVRMLAIAAPQREPNHPSVPTVEEAGGPKGIDVRTWMAALVPSGTPQEVINKINADIRRALQDPAIIERFQADGMSAQLLDQTQISKFIQSERSLYGQLVKALNIQVD